MKVLAIALVLVPLAGCVSDPNVGPDGSSMMDSSMTTDTGSGMDSSVQDTSMMMDAPIDAGPCSNPMVGNVLNLPNGSGAGIIPGSGPLIVGDYRLTGLLLDCNGACGVEQGSILGGLKISSTGPGLITYERRIEMMQGATMTKLIDRWSGTYDQINKMLSVKQDCPMMSMMNCGGGFPLNIADGGPTNQFRVRFTDLKIHITSPQDAQVTAILTFTKM